MLLGALLPDAGTTTFLDTAKRLGDQKKDQFLLRATDLDRL